MSLYETLVELERRGEPAALCTVVRTHGSVPRHAGAKMLVWLDGRISGTVGGGEMEAQTIAAALEVLAQGRPRSVRFALQNPTSGDPGVCGGEVEIFVDPITTRPTLLVIGAGHVGRALVHLGRWLGFRVVLTDDRPEQCTPEAAPGADSYICAPIAELPRRLRFHSQTWIVMPTRGMQVDVEGLPHLLDEPHAYLGVIGSRRRWASARRDLEKRGVAREKLDRVHSPMGIELNAETPEEIALSILAEIVMLRNGGDGKPMHAAEPPA
ncbi:MAG: XdhC family protein [Candidatus Latescibacterota bacterium]|nr:MAG: XdhC family protein [Candidatus Latescibacterota bacterium]